MAVSQSAVPDSPMAGAWARAALCTWEAAARTREGGLLKGGHRLGHALARHVDVALLAVPADLLVGPAGHRGVLVVEVLSDRRGGWGGPGGRGALEPLVKEGGAGRAWARAILKPAAHLLKLGQVAEVLLGKESGVDAVPAEARQP